jgi:hypothetical protein
MPARMSAIIAEFITLTDRTRRPCRGPGGAVC